MPETAGSSEDALDSPLIEYAEYCFNLSTATDEEKGWDSSVPSFKNMAAIQVQVLIKPQWVGDCG